MSRAILAPSRFQDNVDVSRAEWLRFEDELQARFLCLFSENGIAIPEGHPVEESQWRDLAICLAIKSGELSVNLGGENLPSPPISWQSLDSMKETKERRDFRPALDKDLLKDELFRFFYHALRREHGGDYAKHISPVMWKRYYNRKTVYVRDYGFPPAMQRLSLRFQQCAEMDRLREARKLLRLSGTEHVGPAVTKTEAARYAAAELHLWLGTQPPTMSEIDKLAEDIRSSGSKRKAIENGPSDVLHPRIHAAMRIQSIYAAIDRAARRLWSPLGARV